MRRRTAVVWVLALGLAIGGVSVGVAQQVDPGLYAALRWRQVGPFRGGRVTAVAGVPGRAAIYYVGTAGGGLWETIDGGWVWNPIFDQAHIQSIGAIAIAASNPQVIYVGTGDVSDVGTAVNQGDGMWKSTDGGRTWRHVGLDDTRHIGSVVIDPRNPDVVLVAALGHTFAPNVQRGVFRTDDGGRSWRKVLYKDDVTGAVNLAMNPSNPRVVFAVLWHHYSPPGGASPIDGGGGGWIYRSTDEGRTWTEIAGHGLPPGTLGRIGVAVAPGGRRVYAIIAGRPGGLYRSDDGGAAWRRASTDPRVTGNGYFSEVFVDPKNADTVYVAQTSLYRSVDGGRDFISFKGAPGGDDNHALWIDPTDPLDMILGSDQGATISLDGGKSWSSWYNQPTGQIYHLSTDNRFPFWIYGTQQDSGAVGVSSRGDYGAITIFDWDAVGGDEFGYIVPDPQDPNIVFSGGPGRDIVRINRRNHQVADVAPDMARGKYNYAQNPPLVFSPRDPSLLYLGMQYLLATRNGGMSWQTLSPDLATRAGGGRMGGPYRPAISTIAPSSVASGVIWVGTNTNRIQMTKDGGATWSDVTPLGVNPHGEVDMIEASHFDPGTAYAAIAQFAVSDFKPYIFRTTDYGQSWRNVANGIPDGSFARVVREDPARRGLLYAGTENGVYVSLDNGDHWQSLQLNLPTVSVRDLAVEQNDLVAATYGRAFWILDDLTPLRQIDGSVVGSAAHLFRPEKAIRVRRDENQDTPLPPEIPAGQNPPDGAILDYYLAAPPASDIQLSIYDAAGTLVRRFSSAPLPALQEPPPPVPSYWLAHPAPLPKRAGLNRFVWDLRYPSPPALRHDYPIFAVIHDTPADPRGPLVVPGTYTVRLAVAGQTYSQPLTVEMDPRVSVSAQDLAAQLGLEQRMMAAVTASYAAYQQAAALRSEIAAREKLLGKNSQAAAALTALAAVDKKAAVLEGAGGFGFRGAALPSFAMLNGQLGGLATTVDQAAIAPTAGAREGFRTYCRQLDTALAQWSQLGAHDVPAVNSLLAAHNVAALAAPAPPADPDCGSPIS